jgi:hypothetical protein
LEAVFLGLDLISPSPTSTSNEGHGDRHEPQFFLEVFSVSAFSA